MLIMPKSKREAFAAAALGIFSLGVYGAVLNALVGPPEVKPVKLTEFKAKVERRAEDILTIVMLHRNECAECPAVMDAFNAIKYRIPYPFEVQEINAERSPDIAAALNQRDPQAPAILHVFYKGEKIHESVGVSTRAADLRDYIEMADALARNEVSSLDRYQSPKP